MERKLSWNPRTLQAELVASDESVNKLLVSAKITSLKHEGKDVAASDAPLNTRIEALGSLLSNVNNTADSAELIAVNGQLAAQVDKLSGDYISSQATVSSQLQKITALENDNVVQRASVTALTADKTQLTNTLDASVKEASRLSGSINSINAELSKRCLAYNSLPNLTAEDGVTPLATNATNEQKLAALNRVSVGDKLTLIDGHVNASLAKVGIANTGLPAATQTGTSAPQMSRKDFEAMTPAAQSDFFKRGGKITQ
jgi:hypothetical protein